MPFKLNQHRHHSPKQKHRVTNRLAPNWLAHHVSLRQRSGPPGWFTDDAIQGWQAQPVHDLEQPILIFRWDLALKSIPGG